MKTSLIVPVLNEEEALPVFYNAIRNFDGFGDHDVEIVFINDGSSDRTEQILQNIERSDPLVKHICFTHNFGKEPARFA